MDIFKPALISVHPDMADFGSGQGPQQSRNRRRNEATPRTARRENAGMRRKTPFTDGH